MGLVIEVTVTEDRQWVKDATVKCEVTVETPTDKTHTDTWEGNTDSKGLYRVEEIEGDWDGKTLRVRVIAPPSAQAASSPCEVAILKGRAVAEIVIAPVETWLEKLLRRLRGAMLLRQREFQDIAGDAADGLLQALVILLLGCLAFGWCVAAAIKGITPMSSKERLLVGMLGISVGVWLWMVLSFFLAHRLLGTKYDESGFPRYLRTVGLAAAPLLLGVIGPWLPVPWLAMIPIVPWHIATTTLGVHHGASGSSLSLRWPSIALALTVPLLMFGGMYVVNAILFPGSG